ncbi:ParB/RepB/Spo0J family partition protein [Streptomyces sp. NPDC005012]|uniref:ParB/RepB/Spo0J family partition protein n=1 Tax=Streptomyces sp. NPDC005012 TaxID=3154558 RepID=UPI0033A41A1A
MQTDFGTPPEAHEIRETVEQRLKDVHDGQGVPETLTVEFRGQPRHVEVIDMPVHRLFYNPGTHRIRAQRSHDPEQDGLLQKAPWRGESQAYLHELLKALPSDPSKEDPRFRDLLDSLRDHKQLEPGLITRDGILVNGNTRRAALKELGFDSIRVGVLPASTTWADIHAVELSLQLRPDRRREYSYINHLLALDEQLASGRHISEVAKEFHTTSPACERDIWILNQLRELIDRSEQSGRKLRLMDFEEAKEKLFELYRAYTKEHAKNKEQADLLKEARLVAIALNFSKTDVRFIGPKFQAQYLDQRLPDSVKKATAAQAPAAVTIPGLNRTVQASGAELASARALTDYVLKAKAVQVGRGKEAPPEAVEAAKTVDDLKAVFEEAVVFAGKDVRLRKKRQAAPDRVTEACKSLEQCITDLVMARGKGSLDEGAFDDALLSLRSVMHRLAVEAGKSIPLPDEGLTWLRSVTKSQG